MAYGRLRAMQFTAAVWISMGGARFLQLGEPFALAHADIRFIFGKLHRPALLLHAFAILLPRSLIVR